MTTKWLRQSEASMRFHSGRFCFLVKTRKARRTTESAMAPRPRIGSRKKRGWRYHSFSGNSSDDSRKIIRKTAWQARPKLRGGLYQRWRIRPPASTSVQKTVSGQRNSQSRCLRNRRYISSRNGARTRGINGPMAVGPPHSILALGPMGAFLIVEDLVQAAVEDRDHRVNLLGGDDQR